MVYFYSGVDKTVTACLVEEGEPVRVKNFGAFSVRHKGERLGRNPQTGEEVMITPRKVVVFRPSQKLKHWVNLPEDLPRRVRRQEDLFES